MGADAAQRVQSRLLAWVHKTGHGSKTLLAKAVASKYGERKSRSWVTGILKPFGTEGHQDIRLKDLDALASALGVHPGELVAEEGNEVRELTRMEARLVDYYRSMPQTVGHHWIATLDYLFRFQQTALKEQGRHREAHTQRARGSENPAARLPTGTGT